MVAEPLQYHCLSLYVHTYMYCVFHVNVCILLALICCDPCVSCCSHNHQMIWFRLLLTLFTGCLFVDRLFVCSQIVYRLFVFLSYCLLTGCLLVEIIFLLTSCFPSTHRLLAKYICLLVLAMFTRCLLHTGIMFTGCLCCLQAVCIQHCSV